MKQQINAGQWQALAPQAQWRWQAWCRAHEYPPIELRRPARWEDGWLAQAPSVGQFIEYLAEEGRLDHDR
jgi:hypothetical protein